MSDLTTKAAYLKGLADGMKLDTDKDCNKIMLSIIELFGEMAEKIDAIDSETGFLADSIEDIDDELDEIAEILSDCGACECDLDMLDDDDGFEVVCPGCQKSIPLDMDEFEDETICPFCGEAIEFDFDFGNDFGGNDE